MNNDYNKNYNNNDNNNNISNQNEDSNVIVFIVIVVIIYFITGKCLGPDSWSMYPVFKTLSRILGDSIFVFVAFATFLANIFSLYVFFQKNCDKELNLTDEGATPAIVIVLLISLFLSGCYCTFPLWLLFVGYFTKDGISLYSKYNKIPTNKELNGMESLNEDDSQSNDSQTISDVLSSKRVKELKDNRRPDLRFTENKFKDISDFRKKNKPIVQDVRDYKSSNIVTPKYNMNKDYSFQNNRNNIDEKDKFEKIEELVNLDNIEIKESNTTADIPSNDYSSMDSFISDRNETQDDTVDIKIEETNDISDIEKADSITKPIGVDLNSNISVSPKIEIGNKAPDINNISVSSNNAVVEKVEIGKIKSDNSIIDNNTPIVNKVEVGLYKPELSKIDISIKKPEINNVSGSVDVKKSVADSSLLSSASVSKLDNKKDKEKVPDKVKVEKSKKAKKAKEQKKETLIQTTKIEIPSLLGSIDIGKSSLGSFSLTSSIDIKPLPLDSVDKKK